MSIAESSVHSRGYVINLERRKDRWAAFERSWKDTKPKFMPYYSRIDAKDARKHGMSGAWGCRISHYCALYTALEDQWTYGNQYIVICEDDCQFSPACNAIWDKLMCMLPGNRENGGRPDAWDFISGGISAPPLLNTVKSVAQRAMTREVVAATVPPEETSSADSVTTDSVTTDSVIADNVTLLQLETHSTDIMDMRVSGTHCIIYTVNGARRALDVLRTINCDLEHTDHRLYSDTIHNFPDGAYLVVPYLAYVMDGDQSDIRVYDTSDDMDEHFKPTEAMLRRVGAYRTRARQTVYNQLAAAHGYAPYWCE